MKGQLELVGFLEPPYFGSHFFDFLLAAASATTLALQTSMPIVLGRCSAS